MKVKWMVKKEVKMERPQIHLFGQRKPMILSLAMPDTKKNLTTLVKSFSECRPLKELSNLTWINGNRDNIDEMSNPNSSSLLLSILKMIDRVFLLIKRLLSLLD
ncbi:hypothetical protein P3S68_015655 [Capsicum galapagoense]